MKEPSKLEYRKFILIKPRSKYTLKKETLFCKLHLLFKIHTVL